MRYQGVKKYLFFGNFGVLYFLVTSVLRFALLPYYRAVKVSGNNKHWFNEKHLDNDTMKSVNFETIPSWKHLNEKVLWYNGETFEVAQENWRINKVYNKVGDKTQS